MGKDVIIACDFSDKKELFDFLDLFHGQRPYVKIGMELFYSQGPQIVRDIKSRGHKIFLDLKLHDIPNTVMKAMGVLSLLDIDMCNIHASGGSYMMQAAVKGLTSSEGRRPLLIAVTQLTSVSEEVMHKELLISGSMNETVSHYALNAFRSGLDGVVCSPLETEAVHKICGRKFITVTPGIRFSNSERGDQVRITDPKGARSLGSDYIVVGRAVTAASDPVSAYDRCVKEFVG